MRRSPALCLFLVVGLVLSAAVADAATHRERRSPVCHICDPICKQPCYYRSFGGCKLNRWRCPWLDPRPPLFAAKGSH